MNIFFEYEDLCGFFGGGGGGVCLIFILGVGVTQYMLGPSLRSKKI